MKFTDFASYIRFHTRTTSVTFTDADILILANAYKDKIAQDITKVNEDYFGMDYLQNLVADQREYPLPDELQQIKYVEAKLDGTNWKRLEETDINRKRFTSDETGIKTFYQGKQPEYEIYRRSIWIYSDSAIINVTNGLKLKAIIYPADFTDLSLSDDMSKAPTTTSHGLPRPFHELLARRIIIDYKNSRDIPIPLTENEKRFEYDYSAALKAVTDINLDRSTRATVPYDDGSSY